MTEAVKTTDREKIRRWAEERNGHPARVQATADSSTGGVLCFDFGEEEESLERIDWETFFDILEKNDLAVLLQDRTRDGSLSRFFKIVDRHG